MRFCPLSCGARRKASSSCRSPAKKWAGKRTHANASKRLSELNPLLYNELVCITKQKELIEIVDTFINRTLKQKKKCFKQSRTNKEEKKKKR